MKIKHVKGNVLRLEIPLTIKRKELVDGQVAENVEDFYPCPDYPTYINFKKSLTIPFEASVQGNLARMQDNGTLNVGTYQIEVMCCDEAGNPYRYMVRDIIEIVDATADADIEEGVEFNAETYTLEGAVFISYGVEQVQADWTETDIHSKAYINNKPTNLVEDESYVHTDNNYTDEEKEKLDGLENYDDSGIRQELDSKVDKENGKGLSTNDYTDTDKNKLGDLPTNTELTTALAGKASTQELDYYVGDATFVKGMKVNAYGNIVSSNNTIVSQKIPCLNGDTIVWTYNSDQSVNLFLEVFDASDQKMGSPYSSANGSSGRRTFKISNKEGASYLIATFADNALYTPSVYINGTLVWRKTGIISENLNRCEYAIDELSDNALPKELVKVLNFIGHNNLYAYSDALQLTPSKEYSLMTPTHWDNTGVPVGSSYYGLTIESYDANDVKTIVYGVYTPITTTVGVDAIINFLVPADSTYIKIGGRAHLDTKVWFAIYLRDNTITESGKNALVDNTCYANMQSVEIIAHRGYHSNNIPENSLDAYRMAGYMGYDMGETDFCPTSDGVLVLMHDASINRTMRNASDYSAISETVNVNDKTFAELRSNYVLISSDVRYRRPIPTLEEYFKVCKESGIFPLPEIKTSGITNQDVDNAYELGCKILGEGNFGFCSFSYSLLDYARTLSDKIPLYYIGTSIVDTTSSVDGTSRNLPQNVWYPQFSSSITQQNIESCHAKGIRVAFWGVTPSNYNDAIQVGVDIICGDVIAPSIRGMFMFGIRGQKNYNMLTYTGDYANGEFMLDTDEYVSYKYNNSLPIGCHYLSIICQGDFTITGTGGLSCTISHSGMSRCIIRGLCNSAAPEFKVTSNADGGIIQFVEYYIQQF